MLDQLYAYNQEIKVIKPRTAKQGVIELHPIEEGRTFLFEGSMNKEECEAGVKNASFKITANAHSPAYMFIAGDQNQYTIFTEGGGSGYVRVVEC